MIITIVRANIHGSGAFVPSFIHSLMTDRIDEETAWYPSSAKKLTKDEKRHIYRKLKEDSVYKGLSKRQKMFAKHYIRGQNSVLLVTRTVCEAIVQATRV